MANMNKKQREALIKFFGRNSNPSFSDDQGDDISLGDLTRKGVQYPSRTYDSLGGLTPRMAIKKARDERR